MQQWFFCRGQSKPCFFYCNGTQGFIQDFGLGGESRAVGNVGCLGASSPRIILWNLASLRLILGTILMSIHMQLSPFGCMMPCP